MTNSTLFALIILAIILLAFFYRWLIHNFASMKGKEKEIFDDELAKKVLDEKELREKIKKITND